MQKIAKECGVGTSTIEVWLRKHGIHIRTFTEAARLRTDHLKEGATLDFANKTYRNRGWLEEKRVSLGLTVEEIAEMCDVTHHTICHWLKIWGFKQGKIKLGRSSVVLSFTVPNFMRDKVDEFCRRKGTKRSALVRRLIIDEMKKNGFDPYK